MNSLNCMNQKIKIFMQMCFAVLVIMTVMVLPVRAKETETAGASLGKETEMEDAISFYASAVEGWVQTADGRWWYQYNDGSWPKTSWRKINGSWYYFDSNGYWGDNNVHESGSLKGIDVSQWQGNIDWQAVKDDGIQFALIRLGHGIHELDTYYQRNMQNANAAGIPVGVYFYSTAKSEEEAIADAQFVISNMKGYLVSYPVVIDLEDSSQASLSKTQLGKIAKAYCDEIHAAGYTPMLYCNENWYRNHIDISQITDVEMWVARYGGTYSTSIPRGIWQCCSTGRVNGIGGDVDIDFGYKDYTQIVTPRTDYAEGYVMTEGIWVKDGHGWWYRYFAGGYPANTWKNIRGNWYWFDADGYMETGWHLIDGTWYYFNSSGAMVTGWQLIGNTWYYMDGSGAMATGWCLIGGTWYYFNGSGAMETGWHLIDGTWYYFNGSSGAMTTGWQLIGNTWYYLGTDGKMVTGLTTVTGAIYYLESSGAMATGWRQIDGIWYYFNGSGAAHIGWLYQGNTWYYLNADGKMMTGWQTIGDSKYYLYGSGAMAVGRAQVDGVEYDFGTDGRCRE